MKSIIRVLVVFFTGICTSFQCYADNGVKHVSKVDGVSPMWLFMTGNSKPKDLFADGDEAKFIAHCNGSNKIFIYELGSKPYICNSRFIGKSIGSNSNDYEVDILGVEESEKKIAPKVQPDGQGIYTISRNLIPQKRWAVEPLSPKLISQLQGLSKNKYKCPDESPCQSLVGKKYNQALLVYPGQIRAEEIDKLALKIKGSTTELLITPVAIALVGDMDGGTGVYISTVFSKSGEDLKFIGSFTGTLIRIGADIDQDEWPEIIVNSSVEYSQVINFFKIHPKVESLMSYTHW